MQNRKIVIITTGFPFGVGEKFLESEIETISGSFEIDILPMNVNKIKRKLPRNVKVNIDCRLNKSLIRTLYYFIKALFSMDLIEEIKNRKDKINLRNLKRIVGYIGRGLELSDAIEKYYKNEFIKDNIILYSHWFLEGAYAASILRKKWNCKVFARAHGVDVWDNVSVYGIVPVRKETLQYITKVFVCSREGCDFLKSKHSVYFDKFEVNYLGTKDYGEKVKTPRMEKFVIATCARMVPLKRIDLLINALKLFKVIEIEWYHFGDGPERVNIESMIKTLPSNVKPHLLGNVDHDTLMTFYSTNTVHLFVNTSTTEGLPVSIMEAISFGIPVIATNVGGTKEIVSNYNGFLVDSNCKTELLARKIEAIFRMDDEDYLDMCNNSRHIWETKFSGQKNYPEFYKLMSEGE